MARAAVATGMELEYETFGSPRDPALVLVMGGTIVQTMAIEHPQRLASMTSIMSTTGEESSGQAAPEAMEALLLPPPAEREAFIEAAPRYLVFQSRKYRDPDEARRRAARDYDRSFYPEGSSRQLAAIAASGSRADGLRQVRVPTLVIHGRDDTLIAPTGGERTAELVDGAHFVLVADMGHDLPLPLVPFLVGVIAAHTSAASPA